MKGKRFSMSTTSDDRPDERPGDDERPDNRPIEHEHSANAAEQWRKDAEARADEAADKAADEAADNGDLDAIARRLARRVDLVVKAGDPSMKQLQDVTADWEALNAGIRKSAPALDLAENRALTSVLDLVRTGGSVSPQRLIAAFEDAARPQPLLDDVSRIPDDWKPRRWLVDRLIPHGRLSALYGAGEVGKSRLALQLAAAVACEHDEPIARVDQTAPPDEPPPMVTEHGPVLMLSWEDEADEISRRWSMARNANALPPADRDRVHLLDMRRIGGSLWAPRREGTRHTSTEGTWTDTGRRLIETLPPYALCVIDPIAAAYACSENDRALVRAFLTALDAAAEEHGTTVLLIGHPPKNDASFSGSTDWRNGCRAMLTLERVKTRGDRRGIALSREKSNYGPPRRQPTWLYSRYEAAPRRKARAARLVSVQRGTVRRRTEPGKDRR